MCYIYWSEIILIYLYRHAIKIYDIFINRSRLIQFTVGFRLYSNYYHHHSTNLNIWIISYISTACLHRSIKVIALQFMEHMSIMTSSLNKLNVELYSLRYERLPVLFHKSFPVNGCVFVLWLKQFKVKHFISLILSRKLFYL